MIIAEKDDIREQMRIENRVAANWLIHYRERARDHAERRREIEAGKRQVDENVGGGRGSMPGNPTQAMVMALAAHDDGNNARWLKTVESVMGIVGPKKRELIELRQECRFYISPTGGRPGWIQAVQVRFGEKTGWTPSEQILKNYWNDIVTTTVRVAALNKCKF